MDTTIRYYDPQQLKCEFDRHGFVVIRGFLRGAELNELQREIARYIARIPELPRTDVMYEDRDRPESRQAPAAGYSHGAGAGAT